MQARKEDTCGNDCPASIHESLLVHEVSESGQVEVSLSIVTSLVPLIGLLLSLVIETKPG